jgi:CRP-like cAMP-binding protein
MGNRLTRKLEQFVRLSPTERLRLDKLAGKRQKVYRANEIILEERTKAEFVLLVVSGLAARCKILSEGRRQIMAFLIPGDLCDIEGFVLNAMDHDIIAVTETVCAHLAVADVEELLTETSTLTRALWWSTMTDSAILRERIIDHGSRDARERICHLIYEMLVRYRVIGVANSHSFPFPITQELLADATGMTPVHVNRILSDLRTEGLLRWKDKTVTILDVPRFKEIAQFDGCYLHLERTFQGDAEVSERAGDLL